MAGVAAPIGKMARKALAHTDLTRCHPCNVTNRVSNGRPDAAEADARTPTHLTRLPSGFSGRKLPSFASLREAAP